MARPPGQAVKAATSTRSSGRCSRCPQRPGRVADGLKRSALRPLRCICDHQQCHAGSGWTGACSPAWSQGTGPTSVPVFPARSHRDGCGIRLHAAAPAAPAALPWRAWRSSCDPQLASQTPWTHTSPDKKGTPAHRAQPSSPFAGAARGSGGEALRSKWISTPTARPGRLHVPWISGISAIRRSSRRRSWWPASRRTRPSRPPPAPAHRARAACRPRS